MRLVNLEIVESNNGEVSVNKEVFYILLHDAYDYVTYITDKVESFFSARYTLLASSSVPI